MFIQQQSKHQESQYSHMRRSPTTVSSVSSWHPISSSPSEDMWELPASSSSMDDRDDFSPLEFSIYEDHDDYSALSEQDMQSSLPSTVTIRGNHHNNNRSSLSSTSSRNSGLSKQRCVLGDATNTTLRRQNNASNTTRQVQRSYFS